MIGVDKIDDIRRLGRGGASVASISRDTGVSEPTVRKYLRETDLSERPPAVGRAVFSQVVLSRMGPRTFFRTIPATPPPRAPLGPAGSSSILAPS